MARTSRRNQQQIAVAQPSQESSSRKRQRVAQQAKPWQRIGLIALFIVLALGGFTFAALSTGSRATSASHASSSSEEQAGSPIALASLTSSSTGNLPTLVAAREGDINAKFRQVVKTARANGNVTLTIRDNDTGELFTLTQPVGTNVVPRDDKKGGTEVLTRLPSVPEHIDMEKYAFPTSSIETIKKGQQVVTRDPVTGKTEIKTVARVFQRTAYEIIQLNLADKKTGKAADSIRGTPEHPFFTPNGMVEMGKLKPGMEVSTRNNDELLIVKAIKRESHPEGIPVYNFETEDNHTYFVGQANGGTLVHNMCDLAGLRASYVREVNGLADTAGEMRAAGHSSEEIARALHAARRELGVQYKALTPAGELERIYARNLSKYGDKLGPTIDWLRANGKSWEDIIESASRTGGRDLGY